MGECENACFPGLVVCAEHARKETLEVMVKILLRDFEQETGRKHQYELEAENV